MNSSSVERYHILMDTVMISSGQPGPGSNTYIYIFYLIPFKLRCWIPKPAIPLYAHLKGWGDAAGATTSFWKRDYNDFITGVILGLRPANERRRYFVMTSLVGWVQVQAWNQPCYWCQQWYMQRTCIAWDSFV